MTDKEAPAPGWPLLLLLFFSLRGEPVRWGKVHLVYASTKVRDLPRCVCVCMCVWARAQKPVNMCVCVCARARASVRVHVQAIL